MLIQHDNTSRNALFSNASATDADKSARQPAVVKSQEDELEVQSQDQVVGMEASVARTTSAVDIDRLFSEQSAKSPSQRRGSILSRRTDRNRRGSRVSGGLDMDHERDLMIENYDMIWYGMIWYDVI